MILQSRPTEIIVRKGKKSFEGKTTAKSFRNWLLGRISKHSKGKEVELRFIFEGILNAYDHFHPVTEIEVEVDSWKGKSSLEIIRGIDRLTIVKYQKPSKYDEPREVRTDIFNQEIDILVGAINHLFSVSNTISESPNEIKTRELAKEYCKRMQYDEFFKGDFWKNFFSDRKLHNKFTLMLGALDKLGIIKYKGGKTTLLNQKISWQEALDNFL